MKKILAANQSSLDKFFKEFTRFLNDKPIDGVRLQETSYIQKIQGQVFTITIKRGDSLNKDT